MTYNEGMKEKSEKFGNELIESLNEAVAHAKGKSAAACVHVVQVPDVRGLRKRLKMSQ